MESAVRRTGAPLSSSLDAPEDWPYLEQDVLRKTRSRKVCMTCHWFRHHAGVNCIPVLTCQLHQGLSHRQSPQGSVVAAGIFARMVDPSDADPRCRLAVEAQDVAAGQPVAQLLGQQRHLIGSEGIVQALLQCLISPHMGQKPQQLALGHGVASDSRTLGVHPGPRL